MPFHRPPLSAGPISEINPRYEEEASYAEKHAVEIARKAPLSEAEAVREMEKLVGRSDPKAKYKIEIRYLESRKSNSPSACSMIVWESGKRFDGGGDQSMFWCRNARNLEEGCGGLIPDSQVRNGVALCPHCNRMVNQSLLPIEMAGVWTPQNLAKEITRVFRHLGSNADIYLKFHITDTASIHLARAEGNKYREAVIYPLSRIMQDTISGADVTKRFEALLTA